jgi:hypothetical protein
VSGTDHGHGPPEPEITIRDVGRPNVQDTARPFRAEWQQHDVYALTRLTREERQTHREARQMLLHYALGHLQAIDDVDPLPAEWESAVAMVDLLTDMVSAVDMAATEAGDPEGD